MTRLFFFSPTMERPEEAPILAAQWPSVTVQWLSVASSYCRHRPTAVSDCPDQTECEATPCSGFFFFLSGSALICGGVRQTWEKGTTGTGMQSATNATHAWHHAALHPCFSTVPAASLAPNDVPDLPPPSYETLSTYVFMVHTGRCTCVRRWGSAEGVGLVCGGGALLRG